MKTSSVSKTAGWLVAILAMGLTAQVHAEAKIAVVNFNVLLNEWSATKTTMAALQNEFIPKQRDLEAKEKELKSKADRLNRDGAVMSETERGNLQKEIAKGQRDLSSQNEAVKEDFEARRNEEGGKLQENLASEIRTYAKNNGYDLVLPSGVVFYAKDTFDITAQVLTYLQSRAPDTKPAAGKK